MGADFGAAGDGIRADLAHFPSCWEVSCPVLKGIVLDGNRTLGLVVSTWVPNCATNELANCALRSGAGKGEVDEQAGKRD